MTCLTAPSLALLFAADLFLLVTAFAYIREVHARTGWVVTLAALMGLATIPLGVMGDLGLIVSGLEAFPVDEDSYATWYRAVGVWLVPQVPMLAHAGTLLACGHAVLQLTDRGRSPKIDEA